MKPIFAVAGRPVTISNILIVDDKNNYLTHARMAILKDYPFLSVTCIDPDKDIEEQVFNGINSRQLIIMDGHLPGTDGIQLTAGLRAQGYNGYIVANSLSSQYQHEMIKAGADLVTGEKNIYEILAYFA
ncbi:MAG TPA: response regulator [Candidatus Omnitrophota bacterium]|nr:response regulator [Candidatus Omnitrophota bacterium]